MRWDEVGSYMLVCIVAALIAYALSRRRHRYAFLAPSAELGDQGAPYRLSSMSRERATPPPCSVRASGVLGLTFAFAAPGWALTTLMVTMLSLDPPPPPSKTALVMWLFLSTLIGLIVGGLLLSSSLALLRADRRATQRAFGAAVASGTIVVGMTVLLLTSLPWQRPFWGLDVLSATITLAPWLALGVALAQWRIARFRCTVTIGSP